MKNMRDLILLCEGLFDDLPAEQAITEFDSKIDPKLGDILVSSLTYKSSDPHKFDWDLEGDDIVVLDQIEAAQPGKGYGKKMMQLLCDICDKHSVRIYLDASPFNTGLGYNQLISFYRSFGFTRFPEMADFAAYPMMRLPK